jgi:hypothetical protein
MIEITAGILGPGIEEEYLDALDRIHRLREILAAFPPSNGTPEGRMVFQLNWFQQEIEASRLPIPLPREHRATLTYLIGAGTLDYLPGSPRLMAELNKVLDGTGLLKQRHFPVVVAMIDDLIALTRTRVTNLTPLDRRMLAELGQIRTMFQDGSAKPPLKESAYPAYKEDFGADHLMKIPGLGQMQVDLYFVLFSGYRPPACKKPPLPAPNPGLRTVGPSAA